MKKIFLILFILMLFSLFSFYPAFTKLTKIETSHFIIYHEKQIENLIDSEYIAFMEQSYTFLHNLFDHSFNNKIYVYFSNREKIANGFNNPMGQSTIYIITTPPELFSSIGYMDEWLKLVFYHELTHQFSLTLKNKLGEFLSYIFGNIFLNSYFNNPFIMVEGVTTSFEGRDKEIGRTFSPYIRQYIMQAIIDGNFKNPYEIESSFDQWPYHSLGYWYGGFFSKFLQENYGMELYIQLWKSTSTMTFEFAIKRIYEKDLLELWDEFYNWIKPKFEVSINFEDCLKNGRKDILSNGRLVKIKDDIFYFYYNSNLNTIFKYNISTKKNEAVLKNILYFYSFEIDGINNKLILSYYDYLSSNIVIKNKIFNLEKKKFEKSILDSFYDIREVNFFNENYIGIDLSRSYTDLVMVEKDKSKNILLKGSKNFYISTPKQLDAKTIIFLGSDNGKRSLYSFDMTEKKLIKLNINANYIYQFNTFEGNINFSYNDDYSLSKFGIIREDKEIHLDKNFSGGFSNGYYIDGKIIYIGSFSNKSLLLSLYIDLDNPEETKKLIFKDSNIDSVKTYAYNKDKNTKINIDSLNPVENKENTKNNDSNIVSPIINKSFSIFPFNENLAPDFWTISTSLYFNQFKSDIDFYFAGIGASCIWTEPISSSMTYFGTYISSLSPIHISFELISSINYFYPFQIKFLFASYWLDNIMLENDPMTNLTISSIDLFYQKISPISKNSHLLNFGIFYKNYLENNFISTYLQYDYFKYLFGTFDFPLSIKNLLYLSNINFDSHYNFKYEFEGSIKANNFGIEIKDNMVISKDQNLTNYGINEYFHFSLYEPLYEIEFDNPDINYNFSNTFNIIITIFETEKMGLLNLIFPSSAFTLGLYIGYKYYLVSDVDYNNLNFNNLIDSHIIYANISLFSFADLIKINFAVSYSLVSDKFYYYFYYTVGNPYNLF